MNSCPGRSRCSIHEQRRAGDRPRAAGGRCRRRSLRRPTPAPPARRAAPARAPMQRGQRRVRARRRRGPWRARPASAPAASPSSNRSRASASAAASVASTRARAALPRSSRASSRSTLDDAPPATRARTASSSFVTSASRCVAASDARQRQLRPDVRGANARPRLGARDLLAQLRGVQRPADHLAPRRPLAADLDRLLGVHEVLQPLQRPRWPAAPSRRGPAPPAITGLVGKQHATRRRRAPRPLAARRARGEPAGSSPRRAPALPPASARPCPAAPRRRRAPPRRPPRRSSNDMKAVLAKRNIGIISSVRTC